MAFKVYDIAMDQVDALTQKGGEIRIGIAPGKCKSEHMIMGKIELNENESIVRHVHDYGEESIYVLQGKARLIVGEVECVLQPDHMYFVPKGQAHSIVNEGNVKLVLIFGTAPLAVTNNKGDRLIAKDVGKPVLGMQILSELSPDILQNFRNLTNAIDVYSPIPLKYKELILIGMFVAYGGERGIDTHVRIALQAGASKEEIFAAIIYALPISGVSTVTQAIEIAATVIDDIENVKKGI